MSDLEFDKYNCLCGTKTYLKKDGTPWKHTTPQGAHCFGSSDPEVEVPEGKTTKFQYDVIVYANSPMVDEFAWQVSNQVLAADKAAEAGYFVVGEGVLKSKKVEGPKIRFTYEVPVVKEG